MLYQLSYTPRPRREVASVDAGRKVQLTMGRPIQLPFAPLKTRCVADR
jgi:hypothetical protein